MATNPAIVADDDRAGGFSAFAPQTRIERVLGGVDADLWTQQAIVTDTYFGSVENDAATVGVEIFANVNVDAIVAIEQRVDDDVFAHAAQ